MICPRCGEKYWAYSAISRRDNKTKICSNCGTIEALFDFRVHRGKVSKDEIKKEKGWLRRMKK